MMSKFVRFFRLYPFSILCIIAIWILSLTPYFPETPLDNVVYIDKWTHLVMYGGTCSVIWWEFLRNNHRVYFDKLFLYAWLSPVLMSGLLELLQEYCTGGHRNGDWTDFVANTLGCTLAIPIGLFLYRLFYQKR